MTPERWKRVGELYEQASESTPEERAALLDAGCEGDAALREEVEKMLAADDAPDLLRAPAWEAMPGLAAASATEQTGSAPGSARRIGPYHVVRRIGRGGMGEVFLATRDVGAARQTVALKLLRPGPEDDRLVRRFADEQRILAQLEHPRIARLLDAGQAEDGRPYLAMEYVDGEPITDYCDRHRLTVDARLRLFRQVCEAVQVAHQRLVVHRDLKPSNVLVSEPTTGSPAEGRVKLLDFGIAKVLDPLSADGALLTQTGRLLTPAYASPEQLSGAPAATTSDVYSLGVLLYELLAGRRPYETGDHSPAALVQIATGDAARPSDAVTTGDTTTATAEARRTSTDRLQRRLRGDLDTIILKALRSDPARRYGSASALAEDVQRHLDGLPVQARPDTLGYRVGKFVRRQWAAVAAAAAFVLLLVTFAGSMAWQQAQTAAERDRAERERIRAEAALAASESVTTFLRDLFEANAPSETRGDTLSARDLLERGTRRLADLDAQPAIASRLRTLIGGIYSSLGDLDTAAPLLEAALSEREARLGEHEEVAASLFSVAKLRIDQGDFDAADSLAHASLAMRRAVLGPEHPLIAQNLLQLATLRKHQGRYDEAAERFRELIALEREVDASPGQRSETLHNYARLLDSQTRYEESAEAFEESLRLRLVDDPDPDHPATLVTRSSLGLAYSRLERHDEAIQALGAAAEGRRRVLGPDHPGLASTLSSLGVALAMADRYAEALPHYVEAERIYRASHGERHPNVSTVLYNRARALRGLGRPAEAEAAFREALSIRREAYGSDHVRTALVAMFLGRLLHEEGALTDAAALFEEALPAMRTHLGPDHRWTTDTERRLAELQADGASP